MMKCASKGSREGVLRGCVTVDNAGQEVGQHFVVKRQRWVGVDLSERGEEGV